MTELVRLTVLEGEGSSDGRTGADPSHLASGLVGYLARSDAVVTADRPTGRDCRTRLVLSTCSEKREERRERT